MRLGLLIKISLFYFISECGLETLNFKGHFQKNLKLLNINKTNIREKSGVISPNIRLLRCFKFF